MVLVRHPGSLTFCLSTSVSHHSSRSNFFFMINRAPLLEVIRRRRELHMIMTKNKRTNVSCSWLCACTSKRTSTPTEKESESRRHTDRKTDNENPNREFCWLLLHPRWEKSPFRESSLISRLRVRPGLWLVERHFVDFLHDGVEVASGPWRCYRPGSRQTASEEVENERLTSNWPLLCMSTPLLTPLTTLTRPSSKYVDSVLVKMLFQLSLTILH